MKDKFRIVGTGCALADFVYDGIDFSGRQFRRYLSQKDGDGGLSPGKLVFTEELEKYSGESYENIILEISRGKKANTTNVGGPSLVSLIHASQLLNKEEFEVEFYGISGNDETSKDIRQLLQKTPIDINHYLSNSKRPTPFTHVLSDPDFHNGSGERTFINNIGAAWDLHPQKLPDQFFNADMICFGGTALTPNLHDELHLLLKRVKASGGITLVNTVYDFRNEKLNSSNAWPLGNSEESYPSIDLLMMDNEEALRISGFNKIDDSINFFKEKCAAFVITRGSDPCVVYSNGAFFKACDLTMPISNLVAEKISQGEYNGDTTGCGDNFTGGMIVSIAQQMITNQKKVNLKDAAINGICSGGFACSYIGGTFYEREAGEKKQHIKLLRQAYLKQ